MTELKHTPAPWEACNVGDYSDYDGLCRVILGDDLRIAVVLGDHDESEANARLIAAAPDLLAALEATRIVLAEHEPHPLPVLAQVLAAIARAKGGV